MRIIVREEMTTDKIEKVVSALSVAVRELKEKLEDGDSLEAGDKNITNGYTGDPVER
jgi:hypothetical protein